MLQLNLNIGDQIQDTFTYGTQPNSLGDLIGNVVGLILTLALLLTLFFILIAGINWLTAEKPDAVEKARNLLVNAIVGLAIVMGAWALWLLVNQFFGLDLTNS